MTVLTPVAKMQFLDASGAPLVGGLLYTYNAGTTTPQPTYTDSTGATANTNPVVLNARGEANIWLGAATYKFKLCDANNTEIWTVDNISAPTTALSPVLSGNVIIDSSSSGAALKIVQTGTGPIFVTQNVNDPDTTPVIIDANNNLGIQTTSPGAALDVGNAGSIWLSNSGVARSIISADGSNSYYSAEGARSIVLKANGTTLFTINTTNATATIPIVLPADPTTALQASTKQYVDTLTGAPAGIIMAFAGSTAPTGFLACDGSAVLRATYATLFAAIGTTWGAGNGTTTFNVPDLRGMFMRGTGTNATGSSSGAVGPSVGTYAADTYLNHSHSITDTGHAHSPTYLINQSSGIPGWASGSTFNNAITTQSGTSASTTGISVNTSTTGGTETKPKNYGVLYIIKT